VNVKIAKEFVADELGKGEASALSLAKTSSLPIITDDKVARAYAIANGIEAYHTTFLLFRAVEKGALTKKDAIVHLDRLVLAGWRCDIETYVRIKSKIEEV
jgi:predicted nucleic acid-binding protein